MRFDRIHSVRLNSVHLVCSSLRFHRVHPSRRGSCLHSSTFPSHPSKPSTRTRPSTTPPIISFLHSTRIHLPSELPSRGGRIYTSSIPPNLRQPSTATLCPTIALRLLQMLPTHLHHRLPPSISNSLQQLQTLPTILQHQPFYQRRLVNQSSPVRSTTSQATKSSSAWCH